MTQADCRSDLADAGRRGSLQEAQDEMDPLGIRIGSQLPHQLPLEHLEFLFGRRKIGEPFAKPSGAVAPQELEVDDAVAELAQGYPQEPDRAARCKVDTARMRQPEGLVSKRSMLIPSNETSRCDVLTTISGRL